ncbi:unnamed protein product, partial [Urochloa humidicola]
NWNLPEIVGCLGPPRRSLSYRLFPRHRSFPVAFLPDSPRRAAPPCFTLAGSSSFAEPTLAAAPRHASPPAVAPSPAALHLRAAPHCADGLPAIALRGPAAPAANGLPSFDSWLQPLRQPSPPRAPGGVPRRSSHLRRVTQLRRR